MIVGVLLLVAFCIGVSFYAGGLKCAIFTTVSTIFVLAFTALIAWLFE